jgi:hypothetical protein
MLKGEGCRLRAHDRAEEQEYYSNPRPAKDHR